MARMLDLRSESHPCEPSTSNFEPPLSKRVLASEDLDEAACTSVSLQCTTEEQTCRVDDEESTANVKHILKPEQESRSCKEIFSEVYTNHTMIYQKYTNHTMEYGSLLDNFVLPLMRMFSLL